jgi:hypothetical protein
MHRALWLSLLLPCIIMASVLRIPDDYATITEGVASSQPGDTVLIAPGTYQTNLTLESHHLTFASHALTTDDSTLAEQTTIRPVNPASSIFNIQGPFSDSIRFVGLRFTGGDGYNDTLLGGAIYANHTQIRLTWNIFDSLKAYQGAGCYIDSSDANIYGNMFSNNWGAYNTSAMCYSCNVITKIISSLIIWPTLTTPALFLDGIVMEP